MNKRENIIIIDTETAGTLEAPLVYDIGIMVVERASGRLVESSSYIISDVFYGMAEQMQSAYYANKLPEYHNRIAAGAIETVRFWKVWRRIRHLIERYNVRRIYAYNMAFDSRALDCTFRTLTNGRGRFFFPKNVRLCCIMHMACQTVLKQKAYARFANANGFISPVGNLRSTAEACYAYIRQNPRFTEAHIGIEDAIIERDILNKILRQKKRMNENPNRNAWKLIQQKG